MKSILLASLAVAAIATTAQPAAAAKYTLSVNSALTTNDPLFKGLESFRDNVEKRTHGAIKVKLFPNSQLGSDKDVIEQARAGAPVADVVDGGRLAAYVKEFGVLAAPYLASGYKGIRKVVTSPMFENWAKKLHDKAQLQVLSFNWWQGERQMWTNKPIRTPADLHGVRVRIPGAPVWNYTLSGMGATPTPMPWSSVYSAMQQHVIDGVGAQLSAGYNSKLYEVTKYLTLTHHINLITGLVASAAWYDSLPANFKKIVREEALKAGDVASYGTEAAREKILVQLKKDGMTIERIDVTPFKDATEGVYGKLGFTALHKKLAKMLAE
ncbi:MAG: C4-dicarboxylate TRAP transporter substrate-binding protein [Pseudolabrys sp.]|jgi:tripartite ATP-independent transporter DctP family solute receptor